MHTLEGITCGHCSPCCLAFSSLFTLDSQRAAQLHGVWLPYYLDGLRSILATGQLGYFDHLRPIKMYCVIIYIYILLLFFIIIIIFIFFKENEVVCSQIFVCVSVSMSVCNYILFLFQTLKINVKN